ncbi:RHS repeat domain-containing protein [Pseudomonas sp. IT-P395]|uniref:RHS repeat domain-containing protein n=1 Tax=Pseudomonas sp. IT-P395 TaxID=3026459 RepID=UPI0039DFE368
MDMFSKTPVLAVNDPRGLAVRRVDYWRCDVNQAPEPRIHRTAHDAAGRAVTQWDPRLWALQSDDPLAPANLSTVYLLNGQILRSNSVDAGMQLSLFGPGSETLTDWDSRGTRRDIEHDLLLRPTAVFEAGELQPRRCAERFGYGQPGDADQARNQLGQLIRHEDPAGSVLFEVFAITGENVESTRHFTLEPVSPDWPEPIDERQRLLEPGEGAMTHWRFGPLGAVLEQIDAKGNRHVSELTLDGGLRARHLQLSHQTEWRAVVSDIHYNAEGLVTQELAGNGVLTTLTYREEDGRLMTRHAETGQGVVLQHLLYQYDRTGNVLSIEDKALPVRYFANQRIEPISRFTYDSLYQLCEARGWEAGPGDGGPTAIANYLQTYGYDAGGNLLKLTHVGAQSPGHDLQAARYSNRCLPWRNGVPPDEAEIAAAFDARGNLLLLDQGRQLQWNLRNQLDAFVAVQRDCAADDHEVYLYDGAGQRVRKIRSLQTRVRAVVTQVRYLPELELRTDAGTGEVLQVITVQTALNSVRVLHWESPPPAGVNDQYRYSFNDHLGSISLELAADAQLISREHFYPFGATAWSEESDISYKTVRYSGKERDATGLYYYGFRYYMPWLQRWLNPDPKGFIDGPNLYQMVGNSPMRHADSDGGKKTDTSELADSAQEQKALLDSMTSAAADVRNSLLNHTQARHRFQALVRRVTTQLSSSLVRTGAKALGGAAGTALGGTLGPVVGALGGQVGEKAGTALANVVIEKVVDTFQLNRPINFKGSEMNPKAFVESVAPKTKPSLAKVKLELAAHDPRTADGRSRLVKMAGTKAEDKVIEIIADKLGPEAPGLVQTVREFAHASRGLNAEALSEAYEHIPVDIDMATFRMSAILNELATAGSSDPELFETVAGLSMQTSNTVQTLERTQDFIGFIAPTPYAGRQQSLGGSSRPKLIRQHSLG